MGANTKKATESKAENPAFTKQQLLASRKFVDRRDIINAVFSDKKKYTIEQAEKLINDFLQGKVK